MPDRLRRWALAVVTLAAAVVVIAGVTSGNEAEEDRVSQIASDLRCPACQSVSVEEASAPIARDIRASIEEQVAAGRSDAQIKDFFVEKYGEWVLLDTPPRGRTLLLWLLPVLGLGFGALAIGSRVRRNPPVPFDAAAEPGNEPAPAQVP